MSNNEIQKINEAKILENFIEFTSPPFDKNLIFVPTNHREQDMIEPADLKYNKQGYQITTGDGCRVGELQRRTKKFTFDDAIERSSDRLVNGAVEYFNTVFRPILSSKQHKSSREIILIINLDIESPLLHSAIENISESDMNLLAIWKEVWCLSPGQAIKIF